jgi:hypothetical protein
MLFSDRDFPKLLNYDSSKLILNHESSKLFLTPHNYRSDGELGLVEKGSTEEKLVEEEIKDDDDDDHNDDG